MSTPQHTVAQRIGRALFAPGLTVLAVLAFCLPASARELTGNSDELVEMFREAIDNQDYEQFEKLVFWKGAGKIKRRIVAFQIRRGLGRPIRSISFEDFPEDGLAAAKDSGKLELNMPVTNRVRVVFDEAPINSAGKLPTSVFLVGMKDDVYRIGLVVRKADDDDD